MGELMPTSWTEVIALIAVFLVAAVAIMAIYENNKRMRNIRRLYGRGERGGGEAMSDERGLGAEREAFEKWAEEHRSHMGGLQMADWGDCWAAWQAALATGEAEKQALRRLLWLGHGCIGLYGDDGEMQCNQCHIDFKRDAVALIEQRITERGMRLTAAKEKADGR